ncbi:MAG TPA: muconolactone Delta-isomerase family protein [Actinophytocola sp.]|uniref:muconolactone Delta-isomerase family protein n=1 Tax=Actinophytocola sp. TaxID=1872138 RepID=UPI002DBE6ACF|nr:muconolactone Delta-isomerase family protein [Actinophytocola sp.]HEU5471877.1 muconolactone Delta-isomerase family protein [Actinophytocola sp.]
MKFLVMWRMELALLSSEMAAAVARMPRYAGPLEERGSVIARYHLVGQHGGAWIYDVGSNEELERLLAMSPVYNFARYEVHPLAEMPDQVS